MLKIIRNRILPFLMAGLLALGAFTGFAGCTPSENSSPQEEISSPEDSSSSFLEDLPTYYPEEGQVLSEWQRQMDENSIFVAVYENELPEALTAETFLPFEVESVTRIEGLLLPSDREIDTSGLKEDASMEEMIEYFTNAGKALTIYLYVVQAKEKSEALLSHIQGLVYVDYAWYNEYDYTKKVDAIEEKQYIRFGGDAWIGFHGYIDVDTDKAFFERIFSVEDFGLDIIQYVQWTSYLDFKKCAGDLSQYELHHFAVHLTEKTDEAAQIAQEEIFKLGFVKRSRASYGVDDNYSSGTIYIDNGTIIIEGD